ncbi:MAG: hypothetical protein V4494_05225 [Chlamydiota bacterium]
MKIFVDNQMLRDPSKLIAHGDNYISLDWPSLFEYLGLGSMLSQLSTFDQAHPLFIACVATLHATDEQEVLLYMYDQLFVENLNQIKALPQMNAAFLLQAIRERRGDFSFVEVNNMLSPALDAIEAALIENAPHIMHDLILYLAWDRMCVYMAHLFDDASTDPKFIKGIGVLKECLIESYQHIAKQERTSPGIYRMIEALFFYQMREENREKHTDAAWAMLSQSFQCLKAEDQLVDFFYIDRAVFFEKDSESYLTLDSLEKVSSRLAFAQYMMDQIKLDTPEWNYVLHPQKIVCL